MEAAAEADDELHEQVSSRTATCPRKRSVAGVRKLTIAKEAYPGASAVPPSRTRAFSRCWTALSTTCRAPEDVPAIKSASSLAMSPSRSTVNPAKSDPFAALVFKISTHPFYGKLVFVRVYSGSVMPGDTVLDSTKRQEGTRRQDLPDARRQGEPGGPR